MSNVGKWMHVLWVTFRLRCPHCEQGKIFTGLFRHNKVCSVCGVRFEREDGESVGGMYINLGVAELTTLGGFFLAHALWQPPFEPHLIFWVVYNLLFVTLFYSRSRAMWVGISYLTGGVKPDAPAS